jgi:hypothetical protein
MCRLVDDIKRGGSTTKQVSEAVPDQREPSWSEQGGMVDLLAEGGLNRMSIKSKS